MAAELIDADALKGQAADKGQRDGAQQVAAHCGWLLARLIRSRALATSGSP